MNKARTLYDWFSSAVARHGSVNALEVDDHYLTYDELAARVESMARMLVQAAGGQVPRRVGLLAARSLATYVGYLAIQRLGSTAVPLNPAFPDARNVTIAEAARLDLVLSESEGIEGLSMPLVPLVGVRDSELQFAPMRLAQMTWPISCSPRVRRALPRVYRSTI